ncbi:ribosome maturation factor RimM [Aureibacter tunicatorum]|uniref:Ribosome maturation factor RimM n=1 Tax=Aureibacter tunicatorum TaxID=866807 RepID=A0AAE4BP91_9BACT|nr:ribosome maturation factor RimM [Aureibacter tunicatorum]MDR6237714.1 16S rRNA processing protein RimM [Aureibacter tunicatorum]BDD02749.1 ribosome maturation factor RimM [Aureibacter tunicatorum]
MRIEDCYHLGTIVKKHGLRGEVLVTFDVDEPGMYEEVEAIFLKEGESLLPYFVEDVHFSNQRVIVKFEGVDTPEQADEFKGMEMYLPLEVLPDLGEGKYYYHELIGMQVIDKEAGDIGKVLNVLDLTSQMLLQVDHKEKEVLIPLSDDIVVSVDKKLQKIDVDLPDGLLDLYLED